MSNDKVYEPYDPIEIDGVCTHPIYISKKYIVYERQLCVDIHNSCEIEMMFHFSRMFKSRGNKVSESFKEDFRDDLSEMIEMLTHEIMKIGKDD